MTVPDHLRSLADRRRIESFRALIQSVVGPGRSVVEIGSGLGTYSIFAAQAGARRVWAIESDSIAHVAERIVSANYFDDRVEVVHGRAPEIALPERAEILIFDHFRSRLFDLESVRALRACVDRYLEPGGLVLPGWARLCLAPVRAAEAWAHAFPFGPDEVDAYGIDWAATASHAANLPRSVMLGSDALIAEPRILGETLIHPCPEMSRLGGGGEWLPQPGLVHGLAYWFDLWTGPGGWLSNAPGSGGAWGQLFLPFRTPLEVATGLPLSASIQVDHASDGAPQSMSWLARAGDAVRKGDEATAMRPGEESLAEVPAPAPTAPAREAPPWARTPDTWGDASSPAAP